MYHPKTHKPIKLHQTLLILASITMFFNLSGPLLADNLRSDTFRIDMSTINMTGGKKTSESYNLTDTVGQTFQGQFDSNGYRIRAGFQYIHSIIRFSFTISDLTIELGTLVAQTPSTATNTLTISTGNAYGYTVKAIESYTLRDNAKNILDTNCDSATSCTITDANIWASNTDYGFGYNMSGDDIDTADFIDSTYFRPFANDEDLDSPATVMLSSGIATSSAAIVTYKANISSTQPAGYYTTAIRFIAIPSF